MTAKNNRAGLWLGGALLSVFSVGTIIDLVTPPLVPSTSAISDHAWDLVKETTVSGTCDDKAAKWCVSQPS